MFKILQSTVGQPLAHFLDIEERAHEIVTDVLDFLGARVAGVDPLTAIAEELLGKLDPVPRQGVLVKLAVPIVLFRTSGLHALEDLLLSVASLVLLQVASRCEPLLAVAALEGLLAGVAAHVDAQIGQAAKCAAAHIFVLNACFLIEIGRYIKR